MKIIRAIIGGERNARKLASLRDCRCKASAKTIAAALEGNYRPEHVFALRQALELYDFYQEKIAACDVETEKALLAVQKIHDDAVPELPSPRRSQRTKNEPHFEIRGALHTLLGVDLTQIHGFGSYSALRLISECGHDMSRWPTAKHFTSWLTLAPGNKISGGKLLSSRTRPSTNRAATLFRTAAVNVGKTQTALGAFCRRLAARVGKAKAVTATARKLAVLFYNALRHGAEYVDPGADYYEERYKERVLQGLKRRARSLGLELVPVTSEEGVP